MERKQTKKQILEKALALFRKNGYDAVTIQDICKASGISKNTFYYHYSSKEDLLSSIQKPTDEFNQAILIHIMEQPTPKDQIIEAYVGAARHFTKCGKEIVKKMLKDNLTEPFEKRTPKHTHKDGPYIVLIQGIFRKAMESGQIRNDIDVKDWIHCCAACLVGTVQIWATAPVEFDLEKEFRKNLDIVIGK